MYGAHILSRFGGGSESENTSSSSISMLLLLLWFSSSSNDMGDGSGSIISARLLMFTFFLMEWCVELWRDRQLFVGGVCEGFTVSGSGCCCCCCLGIATSATSSSSALFIEAGGAVEVDECVDRTFNCNASSSSASFPSCTPLSLAVKKASRFG